MLSRISAKKARQDPSSNLPQLTSPRLALGRSGPPSASPVSAPSDRPASAGDETPPRLDHVRLRRLLSYYRPHIPMLLADLVSAVAVSATALLLPLCANLVTKQLSSEGAGLHDLDQIYLVGGIMLALIALQAIGTYVVDFQGHLMGAKMEAVLRRDLFEHCQTLGISFHDRQRVGQLMSRITHDSFALGEMFHHGPEDVAIAVLKSVGVVTILAYLDGPLALMCLALLPFAGAYTLHYSRRMSRAQRLGNRFIAEINERVEDSLAGIRVVKSFANEDREIHRFEAANAQFLASRRAVYQSEGQAEVGSVVVPQLVTVLVIVAGSIRVAQGQLTVADMLTFLLCVAVILDPIARVANLVRLWQEGYTGFSRMMEILEVEPDVQDRSGAMDLVRPKGAIAFEQVGFRYEENGPHVLRNLSFTVRPGEFVALVGASGVGKSTLCALIPRFYDVSEGRILVDGIDIREVSVASLRQSIGVVQQDVYLFAGTVAENIRYGRLDATDAEVRAAAEAANAHDFIMALPQGYDTDIGQRGVKLSGGQRQRLTIARTFLKDPAILIFDEATSALDNESERTVQDALQRLAQERTTLVIAHRLSTVRQADRILVLTEEGIAEEGTHDELLAAGGVYAALYRMQARM